MDNDRLRGGNALPTSRRGKIARFWNEERGLSAMLIFLVLHLFVLSPVSTFGYVFKVIASLVLSIALVAGVLIIVQQRLLRAITIGFVVGAIFFRFSSFLAEAPWITLGNVLFTFLSLSALIYVVYLQISREGPVTGHRIRGAIAEYILIALFFAFLYRLIFELVPGSFSIPGGAHDGFAGSGTFYYFSIVTLTTTGFGDIIAIHPMARSFVMVEVIIGQLYPAILLARLVTLELETRRSRKGH